MAAQLLTPVCIDVLKLQNPSLNSFSSRSSWRLLDNNSSSLSLMGHSSKRRSCGRARVTAEDSASTDAIADDYYAVLGLVNLFKCVCFDHEKCAFFNLESMSVAVSLVVKLATTLIICS